MNNKKIYNIGGKISSMVKKSDTPTEALVNLKAEKNLYSYFTALSPDSFVKLIISVYCNQNDISFSKFEAILDNLFFAVIFYTSGDYAEETCDECGGDGTIPCDTCDGNGEQRCGTCSGQGDVQCEDCDGYGYIENDQGEEVECNTCGGNGTIDCDDCDDGYQRCEECGGQGYESCQQCDGLGEIQTDELIYDISLICSWDQDLKNQCELKVGEFEPIAESYQLDSKKDIIFLSKRTKNAELDSEVKEDEYYCVEYLGDNPEFPNSWEPRFGEFKFDTIYNMQPYLE